MYSIQKESQVTFLSSEYHNKELKLILGDEYGYLRLIKLNPLLETEQIEPVVPEQLGNKNPFRIEDYNFTGSVKAQQVFTDADAIHPQKTIRQSTQFKAHNSRINFAHVIRQTNDISILTVGADHLCKLWTDKGACLGVLRQGQSTNDGWRFFTSEGYLTKEQKVYKRIVPKLPEVYT